MNPSSLLSILLICFIGGSCKTHLGMVGTRHLKTGVIHTEGRVGVYETFSEIYWPGSGMTVVFNGTQIKASLQDEKGYNYFNVVVDDSLVNTIRIDARQRTYLLADGLLPGRHRVQLLKRADWFRGSTKFFGFETDGKFLPDRSVRKRAIEFYGNSVTVGAAVEDDVRDNGDSTYTNNYRSYAAITAKHFNAAYSCIASSGIGLMVSWGSLIMPEIYNRLNPADSNSRWDFSVAQPGIVVINLFQNDQALVHMPEHTQFKKRFGNNAPSEKSIILSYKTFVENIRRHYPQANIICTLGSMDAVKTGSPWPGYIQAAVDELKDEKVFTYFFAYKNTAGHPKAREQQQMANELIQFIDQHIVW